MNAPDITVTLTGIEFELIMQALACASHSDAPAHKVEMLNELFGRLYAERVAQIGETPNEAE